MKLSRARQYAVPAALLVGSWAAVEASKMAQETMVVNETRQLAELQLSSENARWISEWESGKKKYQQIFGLNRDTVKLGPCIENGIFIEDEIFAGQYDNGDALSWLVRQSVYFGINHVSFQCGDFDAICDRKSWRERFSCGVAPKGEYWPLELEVKRREAEMRLEDSDEH